MFATDCVSRAGRFTAMKPANQVRAKAIEEIVERAIRDTLTSPGRIARQRRSSRHQRRREAQTRHRHGVRPQAQAPAAGRADFGLDATTALLVCNKLRDIANGEQGLWALIAHAWSTSIHQPRSSIMPLFDQCVLLADGREVYAGPTYETKPDGSLTTGGVMGWLDDVGYRCPMFQSPPTFSWTSSTPASTSR